MKHIRQIAFVRDGICQAQISSTILLLFRAEVARDSDLQAAFDIVFSRMKMHLTSFRTNRVVRKRYGSLEHFDMVKHWLLTPVSDRHPLTLELLSGATEVDIGDYSIRVSVPLNNTECERGMLRVGLPLAIGLQRPDILRTLALSVAEYLPVVWGQVGFGIDYDNRRILQERNSTIAAWCARYQCVSHYDLDYLPSSAFGCIPSVSWLTILCKDMLDSVADTQMWEDSAKRIGNDMFLFTASEKPILGDRNQQEDVGGYRSLNYLLRECVCDQPGVLPGLDDDQALEWLKRFEKDI
jgi:Protein of unknown function (DUF3396)